MSHMTKMLIACLVPFLLIFLLPLLGISGGWTLWAFLTVFFVAHLWMLRGHDGPRQDRSAGAQGSSKSSQGEHGHE